MEMAAVCLRGSMPQWTCLEGGGAAAEQSFRQCVKTSAKEDGLFTGPSESASIVSGDCYHARHAHA